jgi:hypothetical protein
MAKCNVRPMTEDETQLLVNLIVSEKAGKPSILEDIEDNAIPLPVQILRRSIGKRFTFEPNNNLILLMGVLGETPGGAIMYATYLQWYAKSINKKDLNIEDFCNAFPLGLPTSQSMNELWNGQKIVRETKVDSDNLIDYANANKSIQFA